MLLLPIFDPNASIENLMVYHTAGLNLHMTQAMS